MRVTFSQHHEQVDAIPSTVWEEHIPGFEPNLNIQTLHELFNLVTSEHEATRADTNASNEKGRKRARSPSPQASSKRVRVSPGSGAGPSGVIDLTTTEGSTIDSPYPNVSYKYAPNGQSVTIMQHTFEVHYTVTDSDDLQDQDHADTYNWSSCGPAFLKALKQRRGPSSGETRISFGRLFFAQYRGRLVATSADLANTTGTSDWLFLVPSLTDGIDLEEFGYTSPLVEDILVAAFLLQERYRVGLQGTLHLVLHPDSSDNPDSLPFHLEVDISVSLCISSFFDNLFGRELKRKVIEFEDARRRLLDYVYASHIPRPLSHEGATNIPFFYSILEPAPVIEREREAAAQPLNLRAKLLPFQRRSVAWLLEREGKTLAVDGSVIPLTSSTEYSFWEKIEEGNYVWYYNRLSGVLTPDAPEESSPALGGILAEEPGLGKTMETISLISLNPAPPERNPSVTRWDPITELDVKAIKTTLIVTPPSLASQWFDELATHAPTLKVLVYEGWTKLKVPVTQYQIELERQKRAERQPKAKSKSKPKPKPKTGSRASSSRSKKASTSRASQTSESDEDDDEIVDWCTYVQRFDVVITTYSVLRNDLNVARAPFVRTRRYESGTRFRSPLVMCEWHRVVMDEVQMVGGGKAEDMVALIPRLSSFAVSGTPARQQTSDLLHVLKFLRIDHVIGPSALWDRLRRPGFAGEFAAFFQKYAIRTMKSTVNAELTIPQQTRFLVPIDLGRVERHVYDQNLEAGLLALGLDARGVASRPEWEVDSILLRQIIRKLRGICTHPQVGQLPAYKLGGKSAGLKSMAEVLQNMSDQNWRNVTDDWKALISSLIRKAQLQQRNTRDLRRYHSALETLNIAEKETKELIRDVERVIALHKEQGDMLIQEAKANREDLETVQTASDPKGKGKAREADAEDASQSPEPTNVDAEESESPEAPVGDDNDLPKTPAGKEHLAKRGALRARLREYKVLLHRVKFLQGDVYHVLGERHLQSEEEAYATAEELRKELLSGAEHEAHRAVAAMIKYATYECLSPKMLQIKEPYLEHYGIRSSELVAELNAIIEFVLNPQSELLWQWREQLTSLLTQKLSPGEDEADGQEYQRTLDNQGDAEVYIKAYSALLADMREAMVYERTLLAAHDVREKHVRKTQAAMRAAEALEDDVVELQPEHEILHQELTEQRKELLEELGGRAVKSILNDLGDALARITKDTDPEKEILKNAVANVRLLINDHMTTLSKFESDLAHIRRIFNQRILYFRQLQEISDSVAEIELEGSVENALEFCYVEQQDFSSKIKTNRARQRYLENLNKDKGRDALDEEDETCILCRCDFGRGFITQCAHVFCEDCMKAWFQRKEGKTCPVCRVAINADAVQRFTTDGTKDLPAQIVNSEIMPKSRRRIDYNLIDSELFKTVQQVESFGDYGSKIQTMVRHLLHLKFTDSGSKSIVFSAWADSLHIIEAALHDNGIACLRIDQKSKGEVAAKRFKNDPDIHVLLLHGERENAGLNITCASRVFLMESVVHHGFELQAIARIDRMGQTRKTEVFCYYAEDTIEKNILDLAARQGLSLYTKDKSAGTLNVSSFAQDEDKQKVADTKLKKKVQKGDFILKTDDMLAILFPHLYEDIEYLVPEDGMDGMEQDNTQTANVRRMYVNADAGPSRISR